MKEYNTKTFLKRAIPLMLAAIILCGTIMGMVGVIVASAATEDGVKVDVSLDLPKFYKNSDDTSGTSYPSKNQTYDHVTIVIRVKNNRIGSKRPDSWLEFNPSLSAPDVTLISEGYDLPSINSGEAKSFTFVEGPEKLENDDGEVEGYLYTYEMENIMLNSKYDRNFQVAVKLTGENDVTLHREPNRYLSDPDNYVSVNTGGRDDDYGTSDSTSSDAEVLTTPKMIITSYKIPEVVKPGEEFQVTIEFMNNSKLKNMENVSMTLTPPEGAAIKNGVNKRHYITIPKRQTTSETFTLKANEELKAESLPITVKFDYQYKVDNTYKDGSSEEILSITSIPKEEEKEEDNDSTEGSISSFEILSVIPPDMVYPNEDAYVTVKVINKDHQYDASNVQLTVTGDGLVNNGNTEYHGALTHSSQAEIEMALQFSQAGTYTLEAIVTYEDAEGKDSDGKPIVRINDLKKEFTVTVQEPPEAPSMDMMGGMGMDGMEEAVPVDGPSLPFGLTKTKLILICGGAGIAVLVIVIATVRHIRKKKAEDEDEDI